MTHKGFIPSAATFIRQIRQNLSEGRYALGDSGFSITKELVQNADDADATVLRIGIAEPFAEAQHPLLRSPGMFVINDGKFERHDGDNIRRFGENTKAMDASKIGKFGLGLKSIFHLCEAFFFLACPDRAEGVLRHADVLNPWSSDEGDRFHAEWDSFEPHDQQLILRCLGPILPESRWFCLWIPLRQRSQLRGNEPICHEFPGDNPSELLNSSDLPRQVAALLPLVSKVERVQGYNIQRGIANSLFDVTIGERSQRRKEFETLRPLTLSEIAGKVSIARRDEHARSLAYVGHEVNPSDGTLSLYENDEHWPSDLGRDPDTDLWKNVKEKARQHAGVCLSITRTSPKNAGRLSVSWAVFLPLGEPDIRTLEAQGIDVCLFLHGYFFVDAGRNRPVGLQGDSQVQTTFTSDEQLRRAWNRRLAAVGTMPLVPKALERLLHDSVAAVTYDEMRAITSAFELSPFFTAFRNDVCRINCWAGLYVPGGQRRWKLFQAGEPLVELPRSTRNDIPWLVFPALETIVSSLNVTLRGEPRLLTEGVASPWPPAFIERLLNSVPPGESLRHEVRLDYLITFLDQMAENDSTTSHAVTLSRLVRRGLGECGLDAITKQADHIRRLVHRVPRGYRLPLSLADIGASDALFAQLCKCDVDVVFIPHELDVPDHPGTARLKTTDAISLLNILATRQAKAETSSEREVIAVVAAQLFRRADEFADVLNACREMPLFVARDCRKRSDSDVAVSWDALNDARLRKLLFVSPPSFAYQLQGALKDERVLLIGKTLFEFLFPSQEPPSCRQREVLETLRRGNAPALCNAEDRLPLLETLLGYQAGRKERQFVESVRYLLHGQPTHFSSTAPLLVSQASSSDVWRRVTRIALESQESQWRLIDGTFSRRLSDDDREEFGIQEVGAESATQLIMDSVPTVFADLRPSPTEYSALLRALEDDERCRALPIHEDITGHFVAISANCYWESEVAVPPALAHSVTILRKSANDVTWRRQLELARPLDPVALVELVMGQTEPAGHWQVLLDALGESPDLPTAHWRQLSRLPWLPGHNGVTMRPDDVIYLPRLSDEVARLTSMYPGVFFEPGMIAPDVRHHRSFDLVCQRAFPGTETALSMLGQLLVEDPTNHIGQIPRALFAELRDVVNSVPETLLPCGPLIEQAAQRYSDAPRQVFEELAKPPILVERMRMFLDCLRNAHAVERNERRKTRLIKCFNEYLKLVVKAEGYDMTLKTESLPTRDGEWKAANLLCCDNDGISTSSIVDGSTEDTLSQFMPESLRNSGIANIIVGVDDGRDPDWVAIRPELNAASERLRTYFEPWKDIVPTEQIGGFLALLGDDPGIIQLAQVYLGKNRTVEETRLKFGLPQTKAGDRMEDGLTMMSKQRVVVETVASDSIAVLSLMGQRFKAPRNRTPKNIFVGYGKRNYPFPHCVIDSVRVLCFRLNEIDPRKQNPADLSKLLRDSAVKFIGSAYNSYEYQTGFAAAWDDLSESDQLDISIAQERVVENGFLILDQLGLRSDPQVAAVLNKWDAAQRLLAERRSSAVVRAASGSRNADAEMRDAKSQLRELLESHQDVQSRILESIRERIAEYYQYTKSSIPFEIFQNADDASVELVENFSVSEDQNRALQIFNVVTDKDHVTFAHCGRRINQYPMDASDSNLGFDNDLWKMLVLSLSNKLHRPREAASAVTGKFGLGFKSCYLVAERPQVLSGRLAFEVTGAMYPRRLIGEERGALDACRATHLSGNAQATILRLPLTDATETEVLFDFLRLAHVLVVFARHIRCIILNQGDGEVIWQPEAITDISGCFTGSFATLDHSGDTSPVRPQRGLLLDTVHGCVLFGIAARTFDAFATDVPTIWVTAPTREQLSLGFLINGPFALDVGRAQLARDFEQNCAISSRLGIALASILCDVFHATESSQSWRTLCSQLRLARDATVYDFWDSLFGLLGNALAERATRDGPADALVREVFWADRDRAAAKLYQTCASLPTRLRGEYKQLVSIPEARYALKGILAEDDVLFSTVTGWDSFRQHAPPGTVISFAQSLLPLQQLAGQMVQHIRPLSMAQVLNWEFRLGNYADSATAERLGDVVSKRMMDLVADRAEARDLRELLDSIEFKGRDNRYHPAKQLLLGHVGELDRDDRREDERFRAQFAPDARVLSEEYHGTGLVFFDVCREKLDADSRLMAEWIVQAKGSTKRKAALEYLAHGQLAATIVVEVQRRGMKDTWLEHLASSDAFHALTEETKARLLDLVPTDLRPIIDWDSLRQDATPTHLPFDAEDVLLKIHAWWHGDADQPQKRFNGLTYREEYERRTYPNGGPTHLADTTAAASESRKEWTTLMLLGLLHTMGRAGAGQHRQFLQNCEDDGWLDMFAASEPDSERWMAFVSSYLERQVDEAEYFHWMRQFVGIFQMSRYLDDYIELFLAIDRVNRTFQLTEITRPLASSLFQGGGIGAPPLCRVLGLGACFIVRELVRLGLLKSHFAFRHCFVPTKRVRDVFKLLGCEGLDLKVERWNISTHIYDFVIQQIGPERATFSDAFDIPFQFIAEDDSLQQRFFDRNVVGEEENDSEWAQLPL